MQSYQKTPRTGKVGPIGYVYMIGVRGHIRQHRWVMEQRLGRKLDRDEQVHHINGDRTDNRIENLTVMSNSEHHKYHYEINSKTLTNGFYRSKGIPNP